MKSSLLIVLLAACLLVAGPTAIQSNQFGQEKPGQKTPKQANREYWQGTFAMNSMVNDGKVSSQDDLKPYKLTVRGNKYHFQKGEYNEHGSYKWDVKKKPMEVDIVVEDGPDKGKVWKAIYEANDQRIVLCLDNENKQRPSLFTARAGTGYTTEVWKKVAK